ncbi:hypothetical protein MPER_01978 [Moniliophthora perniciosa FA553]|nr:hypothetical protein MPER_01978 [Moniliophthora perniciosa FA553]
MISFIAPILLLAGFVSAQTAPQWGQCGGIGWSGPTVCAAGSTCTKQNDYYSQCIPGGSGGTTSGPSTTVGGGSGGSSTTTATGGSSTLAPGYSFIRAVVDPNFHKYLRSKAQWTASDACLREPSTAAQISVKG